MPSADLQFTSCNSVARASARVAVGRSPVATSSLPTSLVSQLAPQVLVPKRGFFASHMGLLFSVCVGMAIAPVGATTTTLDIAARVTHAHVVPDNAVAASAFPELLLGFSEADQVQLQQLLLMPHCGGARSIVIPTVANNLSTFSTLSTIDNNMSTNSSGISTSTSNNLQQSYTSDSSSESPTLSYVWQVSCYILKPVRDTYDVLSSKMVTQQQFNSLLQHPATQEGTYHGHYQLTSIWHPDSDTYLAMKVPTKLLNLATDLPGTLDTLLVTPALELAVPQVNLVLDTGVVTAPLQLLALTTNKPWLNNLLVQDFVRLYPSSFPVLQDMRFGEYQQYLMVSPKILASTANIADAIASQVSTRVPVLASAPPQVVAQHITTIQTHITQLLGLTEVVAELRQAEAALAQLTTTQTTEVASASSVVPTAPSIFPSVPAEQLPTMPDIPELVGTNHYSNQSTHDSHNYDLSSMIPTNINIHASTNTNSSSNFSNRANVGSRATTATTIVTPTPATTPTVTITKLTEQVARLRQQIITTLHQSFSATLVEQVAQQLAQLPYYHTHKVPSVLTLANKHTPVLQVAMQLQRQTSHYVGFKFVTSLQPAKNLVAELLNPTSLAKHYLRTCNESKPQRRQHRHYRNAYQQVTMPDLALTGKQLVPDIATITITATTNTANNSLVVGTDSLPMSSTYLLLNLAPFLNSKVISIAPPVPQDSATPSLQVISYHYYDLAHHTKLTLPALFQSSLQYYRFTQLVHHRLQSLQQVHMSQANHTQQLLLAQQLATFEFNLRDSQFYLDQDGLHLVNPMFRSLLGATSASASDEWLFSYAELINLLKPELIPPQATATRINNYKFSSFTPHTTPQHFAHSYASSIAASATK